MKFTYSIEIDLNKIERKEIFGERFNKKKGATRKSILKYGNGVMRI